jgi:sulfur-oxidizing protein SoxX
MDFRALGVPFAAILLSLPAPAADLAPYKIDNGAIDKPLTNEPGNPARGRQIVRDLSHATCLICHTMPIAEEPDHGEIGPSLAGVGSRYSAGELRLRLVDPKALNPETLMPSYYRVSDLYRVWTPFRDQPIYTAQQIEDVVAYLSQLKGN